MPDVVREGDTVVKGISTNGSGSREICKRPAEKVIGYIAAGATARPQWRHITALWIV